MKIFNKMVLGAIVFSISSFANAAVITLTGPGAMDVDTSPATTVSLTAPVGGTITDLDVFIDLDAACCGYDNTVTITHEDSGTTAVLWLDSLGGFGSFGDVLGVTFDDEAGITFIDAVTSDPNFDVAPGSYIAMDLLSIFDGESLAGTWTLSIENTGCCSGEGDDLLGWGLIATTAMPEPSSLALIGLGLLGVGFYSRKRS